VLRRPFSSPGYHTQLTGGFVHSTRESLAYAVGLLDTGRAADLTRAAAMLRGPAVQTPRPLTTPLPLRVPLMDGPARAAAFDDGFVRAEAWDVDRSDLVATAQAAFILNRPNA
jgi:hypothetical protein